MTADTLHSPDYCRLYLDGRLVGRYRLIADAMLATPYPDPDQWGTHYAHSQGDDEAITERGAWRIVTCI